MKFTNSTNIPLTIAVWLATEDGYDLEPGPNVLSATSLQKPIRALVLARKITSEAVPDLDNLVASRLGHATHSGLERAWLSEKLPEVLRNLGHPEGMIKKIRVNPEYPDPTNLNVYVEVRTKREVDGFEISGKFDFCINGGLHDLKTTKTYTYITKSNVKDYRLQGSIYRWLNPDIVTKDYVTIDYLFTDWSHYKALADPKYPQARCLSEEYPLFSKVETRAYIQQRIDALRKYEGVPDQELPLCTPVELWQDDTKYAYYKDPNKTSRATKLFISENDANIRNASDGGRGMVVERPGVVRRCNYCEARGVCTQAEKLVLQRLLQE